MKIKDAETFIQKAFGTTDIPEHWTDLGCGNGTFTYALAGCLRPGSTIYAVDKQMPVISAANNIDIKCIQADMETVLFRNGELDGILMANSFHYVKDKNSLMQRLKYFLSRNGRFLIVEYDTDRANRWVPFSLPFNDLVLLLNNNGIDKIEKIGERSSIFGPQKMYACVIKV